MMRKAFKMKLKAGYAEEYKKRHDEIWPELVKAIEEAGISDYSIYLDEETNILFAFQHIKDHNSAELLPENHVVKKWWAMMGDIMETNPDNSPVTVDLKEMFFLD